MKLQPVFLHRDFEAIVQKVSDNLIDQLQEFDSTITAVHYLYGHPLEIINTIGQYDQGKTTQYDKYPVVAFFLDSEIDRNDPTIYGEQTVNLAIIRDCFDAAGNEVAKERDTNNFIPVLMPIYIELMEQIKLSGLNSGYGIPLHRMTSRYYWGRNGLFKNDANIFNDRVDAIEINDLRIKIDLNYCPKAV
jgi:hypothetical protein